MAGKNAIIILAAGNSSRMGQPKQLLDIHGKKLLAYVVNQACQSKADLVFVVLGSKSEMFITSLDQSQVEIIINKDWKKGMGNSLKRGVTEATQRYDLESVIISVCDQPFLSSDIFDQLLSKKDQFEIIASAYSDGNYGPPTRFAKSQFDNLLTIGDAQGARSLIKGFKGTLGLVPFHKGEIDMDTKDDYQSYLDSLK